MNDFQKKEPTRNEKMIYELAMAIGNIEKTLTGVHRMLTALIAASNVDMTELVKTMRNDLRIGSTLTQITETEKQIIASDASKQEEIKKADEIIKTI